MIYSNGNRSKEICRKYRDMFVFRKIEKDFRVAIIIWSQWTEDNGKLFEVSRFYLRERCRLLMDLLNLNFQTRIKRLNGKCENSEDSH